MDIQFDFSKEKNETLKQQRKVSFDDVIQAVHEGRELGNVEHHNPEKYPNQRILIVEINGYAHAAPFVYDTKKDVFFLKTVYPSRKYQKEYLEKHQS